MISLLISQISDSAFDCGDSILEAGGLLTVNNFNTIKIKTLFFIERKNNVHLY